MRRINTQSVTRDVIHPNDTDIRLKTRKLTRAEAMEFFSDVREGRPVRVIRDGDRILYERDKEGKETSVPQVYTGGNDFPVDAVVKMLRKIYVSGTAQGICDENGNPVAVTSENVHLLLDENLDVVPEAGDPYPFWMHIFTQNTAQTDQDPNGKR